MFSCSCCESSETVGPTARFERLAFDFCVNFHRTHKKLSRLSSFRSIQGILPLKRERKKHKFPLSFSPIHCHNSVLRALCQVSLSLLGRISAACQPLSAEWQIIQLYTICTNRQLFPNQSSILAPSHARTPFNLILLYFTTFFAAFIRLLCQYFHFNFLLFPILTLLLPPPLSLSFVDALQKKKENK